MHQQRSFGVFRLLIYLSSLIQNTQKSMEPTPPYQLLVFHLATLHTSEIIHRLRFKP